MTYTVGQIVKVHFWTKWVDGKVTEVLPHYKEGEVVKVDFEGVVDTYQDYELDRIQDEYRTKIKKTK